MPFSSLPIEIVQQIAACIEHVHRPSLFNFSSTGKACYKASAFIIFQRINVTVHCRATLGDEIDRLVKALSRAESARYVQCITIKGDIRPMPKGEDDSGLEWSQSTGLDEIVPDLGPSSQSRHYVIYDEPVIKTASKEDLSWAPVLSLIQVIPYLKDLIYDCKSQFPPSLLSTLHKQHPKCRLHHLSFRFRTLLWGIPYPYEMELATSPLLYKVKFMCTFRDSDYDDDFNEDAVMDLAAGLAPNLKEVINVHFMAYRSGSDYRRKETWHGLPGSRVGTKGSLTSLTLNGVSLSSEWKLQCWAARTDFTCLQHLDLGLSYDCNPSGLSGETMKWLTQNHSFPQLRTLKVSLDRNHRQQDRPYYSDDAVSFFQALEPLKELSVQGPIDPRIVDAIVTRHGNTLQKLSVRPLELSHHYGHDLQEIPMEFAKEHLIQIQAQCPILEDLSITIKRNMSSPSEASMYRCFSKMKSLRSLFLILDCSVRQSSQDPDYHSQSEGDGQQPVDQMDCRLTRGRLRQTVINCAVDEALARSIWCTINQQKAGKRLERLKLWTMGGGESRGVTPTHVDGMVLKNLSRSWLIERDPRDDRNDYTIRELGKHGKKSEDQITEREYTECAAGRVFRTIWSRREGSKDWRDDWSSFPLQI